MNVQYSCGPQGPGGGAGTHVLWIANLEGGGEERVRGAVHETNARGEREVTFLASFGDLMKPSFSWASFNS